jgi:hypothetical protein
MRPENKGASAKKEDNVAASVLRISPPISHSTLSYSPKSHRSDFSISSARSSSSLDQIWSMAAGEGNHDTYEDDESHFEEQDAMEEDSPVLEENDPNSRMSFPETVKEESRPGSPVQAPLVKRPRGRPRKNPSTNIPVLASKVTKGRSKTGCITCRRRKKKCDETKPECKCPMHLAFGSTGIAELTIAPYRPKLSKEFCRMRRLSKEEDLVWWW